MDTSVSVEGIIFALFAIVKMFVPESIQVVPLERAADPTSWASQSFLTVSATCRIHGFPDCAYALQDLTVIKWFP
jgi:hypothetical protein